MKDTYVYLIIRELGDGSRLTLACETYETALLALSDSYDVDLHSVNLLCLRVHTLDDFKK